MQRPTVFLGDSLTEWGNWNELFPGKQIVNAGVAGNTTSDILRRLKEIYAIKAEKVFLMAGINDLGQGDKGEKVFARYSQIIGRIEKACPECQLLLLSVLPVDLQRFSNPNIQIQEIPELNERIRCLADAGGRKYIHLHPHFADKQGYLRDELSDDGLHLNPQGYQLWKNRIEKYL